MLRCQGPAPGHSETATSAASYVNSGCLEYIFEECGDNVSWKDSGLEHCCTMEESCAAYVDSIKMSWALGHYRKEINIKG
jgi:hypothetical protein